MSHQSSILFDKDNRTYSLKAKIGSGGEGDVFEIEGELNSRYVAKLYKESITAEKKEKLSVMVDAFDERLSEVSAWPKELLFSRGQIPCGFLMPRVSGYKPIHELYNPNSRKRNFPKTDFAFLVQTVRNIISAFANVHSRGFIIGDVNEGNILVSDTAVIKLIDCDSFQVSKNDKVYPCEVGIPMYTPPELQNLKSFRDRARTSNHDIFGMSVICFQLLFMGRHPFVGMYKGPDTPIEKAIEKFWFTYGDNADFKGICPPPEAMQFNLIPVGLQRLFNLSFLEPGTISRPTAGQWLEEINYLKRNLRICSKEANHKFYTRLTTCPWCEFENKKGVFFFVSTRVGAFTLTGFSLTEVWEKIKAVDLPLEPPLDPSKLTVKASMLPFSYHLSRFLAFCQKVFAIVLTIALLIFNALLFLFGFL